MKDVDDLLKIMAILRDPVKGCPWDRQQTHTSILPFTIEEVYELAEAIQQNDVDAIRDELGDLLFQIVFYSQMSSESGDFEFTDVVKNLGEKLKRRHPHVFGEENFNTVAQQSLSWEMIKTKEGKVSSDENHGLLENISPALPALIHALKLQKKAATVGFDWGETGPVLEKIEEEILEIRDEMKTEIDKDRLAEEIGDVLFACVNFARHVGVDAETALMAANRKFKDRFKYIETQLAAQGKTLDEASLEEMEQLWQQAKRVTSDE